MLEPQSGGAIEQPAVASSTDPAAAQANPDLDQARLPFTLPQRLDVPGRQCGVATGQSAGGPAGVPDSVQASGLDLAQESLPFTIRVVDNEEALSRALEIRQAAYARHIPDLARSMDRPDAYDRDPGAFILLAEAKLDAAPIGTMRIQTNCFHPLAVEKAVDLPGWLTGRLVEATRLGVERSPMGRVVKTALFKAFYQYCAREAVDWMVIAGRPPLDRQYASLMFEDVFGENQLIALPYAANIPHRVMAFEMRTGQQRWHDARHPLYDFMVTTRHPDIDISAARTLDWVAGDKHAQP